MKALLNSLRRFALTGLLVAIALGELGTRLRRTRALSIRRTFP